MGTYFVSNIILIFSLLSPLIRVMAYLSACGINFNWFGLPDYAFGAVTITNLETIGLETALMPIPCKFIKFLFKHA
jgi:hypothetical protein